MDRETFESAANIFVDAAAIDSSLQQAFVERACGGNAELLSEVYSLLNATKGADDYFSGLSERLGIAATEEDPYEATNAVTAIGRKGLVIGAYTLTELVGSGGTGTVWRAERMDGQFEGHVAIKLVNPVAATIASAGRLRDEAQHLAKLSHTNIARLLDAGVDTENHPYLVLEFIDGLSIDSYCDTNLLSIAQRIELFLDVLRAVTHAHAHLIVHRDIKPSNVLVDKDGNVKLLDFGIAKLLRAEPDEPGAALTVEIGLALTPEYAAPEQLLGQDITTATDVYALGAMLYKLLSGRNPRNKAAIDSFEALVKSATQDAPKASLSASHTEHRNTTLQSLQRMLRGDLDNVLQKALAPEPEDRYATATDFAADLKRYLNGEAVTAVTPTLSYRAVKFIGRHRGGVAAVLLILATLIAAVSVTTTQMFEARQQRDRAEQIQHFLVDLFAEADPNESKGAEITAREILDRGAERVRRELDGQFRVQADLLETIAGIYASLSMTERASPLLEQSLLLRADVSGVESAEYARTLEELALLREVQGDYDGAEPLAAQALRTRRQLGEPIGTANAALRLGAIFHRKSDLDAAELLYREALTLLRNATGGQHELVPRALHHLGSLMEHRGKLTEAAELHEEGLSIRRSLVGEEHLDLLASYYNLGSVQQSMALLDDAKRNYQQALSISEKLTPDGNADAAYMLNALATLHLALEEHELAEARFREALELLRKYFDADHPNIGLVSANLGVLLFKTKNLASAEPLLRTALDSLLASIPDHPKVTQVRVTLGQIRMAKGDFEPAEAMFLTVTNLSLERDDIDSPDAQLAVTALVELYDAWARPADADHYRMLLSRDPSN